MSGYKELMSCYKALKPSAVPHKSSEFIHETFYRQLKPSAAVLECINGSHEPIYEWLVLMQSDTLSIYGALE